MDRMSPYKIVPPEPTACPFTRAPALLRPGHGRVAPASVNARQRHPHVLMLRPRSCQKPTDPPACGAAAAGTASLPPPSSLSQDPWS